MQGRKEIRESFGDLLDGKPIAVILHGLSVGELDKRIDEFKNKDWHWVTINRRSVAENILKKIGKKPEAIIAYASEYPNNDFYGRVLWYSLARGNSLQEFLLQCIEVGVKNVILFGADGYSDGDAHYYGGLRGLSNQREMHIRDCKRFNDTFPIDTEGTNILNCSPNSHYELMKIISYDRLLNSFPDKGTDKVV